MKYTNIIDQNSKEHAVSKIILGSVPFGTTMSEETAFHVMDYYYEHGGNMIDTARVYCDWLKDGHGVSETTVGKWIKARGRRNEILVSTKGAHPPITDMRCSRMNRDAILGDVRDSLEALQTDVIDLYYLHRDDESVSVQEIMDLLHELVLAGKVRMIGASNWRMERILEANEYAIANGKTPFIASQIQWSYAWATGETYHDSTMLCMDDQQYERYRSSKMPIFAYTSQANGVFSCGYQPDLSDIAEKHKKYDNAENRKRYQELLRICKEKQIKPTKFMLDYIIENEISGFAIVGCSSLKQLEEIIAAVQ